MDEAAISVLVPRALLESLCDDVEAWAKQQHGDPPHPAVLHRYNRDMGDVMEVRRLLGRPEPTNTDAAFLTAILARAQAGGKATHDEIARLKRLADWADAPPAPGWDGTMDVREVEHAVKDAMGRMG
jgi:hypothetical protein